MDQCPIVDSVSNNHKTHRRINRKRSMRRKQRMNRIRLRKSRNRMSNIKKSRRLLVAVRMMR